MARSLSLRALQAIFAQETGEVLVVLLTITHPNLATPIRLCSDYQPGGGATVSRGNSFSFFPFDATFPLDRADQPPQAKLTADNVDRSIVAALRSIPVTQPAAMLMEFLLASQPDTVEASFNFTMRNVEYDAQQISVVLSNELFLSEPFPGDQVTPSTIPGVFQ